MERLFNLDPQLLHDAVLLAIAVFVMFLLLSYLLFNPARDFLKKREERINEAKILENAREEAANIIARANKQVELERKKAEDDIKKEIITVASMIAGKVVSGKIDTAIQDSLVDETLKEIGEQTWQS